MNSAEKKIIYLVILPTDAAPVYPFTLSVVVLTDDNRSIAEFGMSELV